MSADESRIKTCNRISALLMALLLILQFAPYWHYGEGDALTASIHSYVWFPHHHTGLMEKLSAQAADYSINPVAFTTVGVCLLCILGTVLCLRRSSAVLTAALPIAAGLLGLFGYLAVPAFHRGGMYPVHLLLFTGMLLTGVCTIARKHRAGASE